MKSTDRLTGDEILLAAKAIETLAEIIQLHHSIPSLMVQDVCAECRHPWPCNTVNLAVTVRDDTT